LRRILIFWSVGVGDYGAVLVPNRAPLKMNLCPRALFICKIFMCVAANTTYRNKKTAVAGISGIIEGRPPKLAFCGAYGGLCGGPPYRELIRNSQITIKTLTGGPCGDDISSNSCAIRAVSKQRGPGTGYRSHSYGPYIYQTSPNVSSSGAGGMAALVASMNSLEQTTDDEVVDSTHLKRYKNLIGRG
jgi:hypothetical protein